MWITEALLACRPPHEPADRTTLESAGHSAAPTPHSAASHTGVDHSGGTAPGAPGCTDQPPGCVYITGDERGDYFGSPLDVVDVDGDGRVELLVDEPALAGGPPRTAVHVLTGLHSGIAWDLPGAHFAGEYTVGAFTFALERDGLIFIGGKADDTCFDAVYAGVTAGLVGPEARVGCLYHGGLLVAAPQDLTTCVVGGAPATCASALLQPTDPLGISSGAVYVLPAPLVGDLTLPDAVARYDGDFDDGVEKLLGTADLSGDGVPDLVVAAERSERVAIVREPPLGQHALWDLADTTLTDDTPGSQFGFWLSAGDLDGDGAQDLFVGAMNSRVYGFRGPLPAAVIPSGAADWVFEGDDDLVITPFLEVADFDGDGRADAALSGGSLSSRQGWAGVFLAPPPGRLRPADADVHLASGTGVEDGFGASLAAGDLDGDGRADRAVGAILDPVLGQGTGSVLVFPGGGTTAR